MTQNDFLSSPYHDLVSEHNFKQSSVHDFF